MTPELGQGACQAIEDAVVLARCVKEEGAVEAVLRFYEARRAERAAYVVRQSRRLARFGQLENPLLCRLRDIYGAQSEPTTPAPEEAAERPGAGRRGYEA
jgi:2-polyprenyl-6-methoxyphenol hydroxylase-like FAD-dependent oxidoreductase